MFLTTKGNVPLLQKTIFNGSLDALDGDVSNVKVSDICLFSKWKGTLNIILVLNEILSVK